MYTYNLNLTQGVGPRAGGHHRADLRLGAQAGQDPAQVDAVDEPGVQTGHL